CRSVHQRETVGTSLPFETCHLPGLRLHERGLFRYRSRRARHDRSLSEPGEARERRRQEHQDHGAAHGHAERRRRSVTSSAPIANSKAGAPHAAQNTMRASRAVRNSEENGPPPLGCRRAAVIASLSRAATSAATRRRSRFPSTPRWRLLVKPASPIATSRPSRCPSPGTRAIAPPGTAPPTPL